MVRDGKTVEVLFDSFWADAGRDNLQPDPKGKVQVDQLTLLHLKFVRPVSNFLGTVVRYDFSVALVLLLHFVLFLGSHLAFAISVFFGVAISLLWSFSSCFWSFTML